MNLIDQITLYCLHVIVSVYIVVGFSITAYKILYKRLK